MQYRSEPLGNILVSQNKIWFGPLTTEHTARVIIPYRFFVYGILNNGRAVTRQDKNLKCLLRKYLGYNIN